MGKKDDEIGGLIIAAKVFVLSMHTDQRFVERMLGSGKSKAKIRYFLIDNGFFL